MSKDRFSDPRSFQRPLTMGSRQLTNLPTLALILSIVLATVIAVVGTHWWTFEDILARCASLHTIPSPPASFHSRDESDRFEEGTNATLIRNAFIFTGRDNGSETIRGDLLLDRGIIRGMGKISRRIIDNTPNLTVIDAKGAWVTPGLVDINSHLGVDSLPILAGTVDFNSTKGPILPYLRIADGLNTHDEAYELAMAGGVTSIQVLPGSNAVAGQAFIVKLRKMKDRSATSMIVDPPYNLKIPGSRGADGTSFRWRHMKQTCGEDVRRYGNRMDNMWALRSAYSEAMQVKQAQDEYCAKVKAGLWNEAGGPFPENLRWEMLVDVLRGKVKVSSQCSEAVDLDAMVRLSNEFQFPIAVIQQGSEAWLVPDLLRRMSGGVPSIAMFATNHRNKRETYRGSEFAPRVLAEQEIPVMMTTAHPVINARYLMHEAQQAYYFGLPPNLALASVSSTPAIALGLSHRIGILEEGSDADVVMWDSHPLRLGATPVKVWIDGILQIPVPSKSGEENHIVVGKGKEGEEWRYLPDPPNWDKERQDSIRWDGLPPLGGRKVDDKVVFSNVKEVWKRTQDGDIQQAFKAGSHEIELGTVVVEAGRMTCIGKCDDSLYMDAVILDTHGGFISPGLMSFGSRLGLEEITSEPSTSDGEKYDAFRKDVPRILHDAGAVVRAADALTFNTRDALTAYRAGVTLGTSSFARPIHLAGEDVQVVAGLSASFRTGSLHAMQRGAIVQDIAALHVSLGKSYPTLKGISVSTQIAGLRRLLYGWESTDKETGAWFRKAAEGVIPLVIEVESLDIMANLLILKMDVEDRIGSRMRMVFSGATESHLLAQEIADAGVGVILNPTRPIPLAWDQRRILPGPPLTNDTTLVTLLEHDVIVGIGVRNAWEARNTRFDVQWAVLESNGRITEYQAYALVTRDLEKLLGVRGIDEDSGELAVYEGGSMFNSSSKVAAIISPIRGLVDIF
ncbi:carbohydrate esterase family 9 protein [Gymnopilus junonius]|uniref:Carbohydrate esterase family 9 protein n=1 Tax=Gymnopilus junonius TaxID=109634 RepID=A0A9P5P3K8_GYMJU|nr:carbohydrate esterase family 9 protein [Gymnopilus junonius]